MSGREDATGSVIESVSKVKVGEPGCRAVYVRTPYGVGRSVWRHSRTLVVRLEPEEPIGNIYIV